MTHQKINQDKVIFYKKNGYLLIKNFFSLTECNNVLQEIRSLPVEFVEKISSSRSTFTEKRNDDLSFFNGITYLQNASSSMASVRRMKQLNLLTAASILLENSDKCFFADDEIHIRQPKVDHSIPAHQDNFYFQLKESQALTCYVYLTPQCKTSGGLGFYASNTNSSTSTHQGSNNTNFTSYNKEYEDGLKEDFIYPETNPGDVIFHHCTTYHRAYPNSTDEFTAALSIRVFNADRLDQDSKITSIYESNLKANHIKLMGALLDLSF